MGYESKTCRRCVGEFVAINPTTYNASTIELRRNYLPYHPTTTRRTIYLRRQRWKKIERNAKKADHEEPNQMGTEEDAVTKGAEHLNEIYCDTSNEQR